MLSIETTKSKNEILDLGKHLAMQVAASSPLSIDKESLDQNILEKEKSIIERTLIELGVDKEKLDQLMINAEKNEKNSNQILDFTKDIKNTEENFKIRIIESLWKIIYSDKTSDMYESNLMRRLSGLLYLDNKVVGDIKDKIKKIT